MQNMSAWPQQGKQGRQGQGQRNKRDIADNQIKQRAVIGLAQAVQLGSPGIDAFEPAYTVIGAQARVQLVVANINADHPRSACLQQAIGKAASGHPHVQRPPALHIQAHFSQRAGQLQATARDKAVIGMWFDIQFDIVIQLGTGLAYPVALVCRAMIDPPCVNQMLRGSARDGQSTTDQQDIGSRHVVLE